VAVPPHNTAQCDGKILDEHVITICHLRGGKIHRKAVFGACTEGE
jgi:ketosteroid isomerase-like protein